MSVDVENKIYEMCAYVNILPKMVNTYQNNEINNKKNKDNLSDGNQINSRIKRKASVLNYKQRYLQECISLVQAKDIEVKELKKTLEHIKGKYLKELNSQKRNLHKESVKIRILSKKSDELESKKKKDKKDYEYEEKIVTEKENIIKIIDQTLEKVNLIKDDLNIHKSRLLSLDNCLKKDETEAKKNKESFNAEIIANSLEFIKLEGTIDTGIIINLYV